MSTTQPQETQPSTQSSTSDLPRFLLIAYRASGDESACGCTVDNWDSHLEYFGPLTADETAKIMAKIDFEDEYEVCFLIFANGILIYDTVQEGTAETNHHMADLCGIPAIIEAKIEHQRNLIAERQKQVAEQAAAQQAKQTARSRQQRFEQLLRLQEEFKDELAKQNG